MLCPICGVPIVLQTYWGHPSSKEGARRRSWRVGKVLAEHALGGPYELSRSPGSAGHGWLAQLCAKCYTVPKTYIAIGAASVHLRLSTTGARIARTKERGHYTPSNCACGAEFVRGESEQGKGEKEMNNINMQRKLKRRGKKSERPLQQLCNRKYSKAKCTHANERTLS